MHSAWDDYSDSPISFGFRVLAGSLLIRLKKALGFKWTIRENSSNFLGKPSKNAWKYPLPLAQRYASVQRSEEWLAASSCPTTCYSANLNYRILKLSSTGFSVDHVI